MNVYLSKIGILNRHNNTTIYEKTSLKPWRFYKPKKHARYILETKKGKIKLEIGDHLDFI